MGALDYGFVGRCGVTWKLVRACVRPPIRLVGTGTCHVEADSDDEELLDSLQKSDQKIPMILAHSNLHL